MSNLSVQELLCIRAVERAAAESNGPWVTVRQAARYMPGVGPSIVGRTLGSLAARGQLTRTMHDHAYRCRTPIAQPKGAQTCDA